jgi:ABC-type uncharacterized transport system ATPase subunit
MTTGGSIIYLEDVTVNYDGFKALERLNFYVDRGAPRGHPAGGAEDDTPRRSPAA